MSRLFYIFGFLFFALYALVGVFSSLLYSKVGMRLYYLPSYDDMYLVFLIVFPIVSNTLVKYYHSKRYWAALFTGGVYTAVAMVHGEIIRQSMISREPDPLGQFTAMVALVSGILYALSLIFSSTRKQTLLLVAGLCLIAVLLITQATNNWGSETRSIQTYALVQNIRRYNAFATVTIPLMFMMQFLLEARREKKKRVDYTSVQKFILGITCIAGMVIVYGMFYTGSNIIKESQGVSDQVKPPSPKSLTLAQSFEAKMFIDKNRDTLPYRLLTPLSYDVKKQYPLVVCLHHGGAHGTDNVKQMGAAEPSEVLSMEVNRKKYPCFLFVPQCPPGFSWGGNQNQPAADSLVFKAIRDLQQRYRIDKKRVYVAGISMGGFGSWHFVGVRPEMFAAAIPICGIGDTTLAERMIDVPIWAFHGEKDPDVPVERTREMITSIGKAGGSPVYTEFAGAGHNIADGFLKPLAYWIGCSLSRKSSRQTSCTREDSSAPPHRCCYTGCPGNSDGISVLACWCFLQVLIKFCCDHPCPGIPAFRPQDAAIQR